MKLVVLDSVYLAKRHIDRLKKLGQVLIFGNLPNSEYETLQRIKNTDIIITASVDINGRILKQSKSLKMISLACSGYNRIDLGPCNELGIVVTNVPSYATEAVAEHTFALLLARMKNIIEGDGLARAGRFNQENPRPLQLKGKIFGIIGTGRIGSYVAKIANCLGCKVIATTLHPSIERGKRLGVKYVQLTGLLKESDIISLHIPLNSSTVNLISYKEFSLMKRRPILINTSRGKVINHSALVDALSKGIISGAGLDVLPYEPPHKGDPLLQFHNVVFNPHSAFSTPEALEDCADTVIANIESFINSEPKNVVNNPVSVKQ